METEKIFQYINTKLMKLFGMPELGFNSKYYRKDKEHITEIFQYYLWDNIPIKTDIFENLENPNIYVIIEVFPLLKSLNIIVDNYNSSRNESELSINMHISSNKIKKTVYVIDFK